MFMFNPVEGKGRQALDAVMVQSNAIAKSVDAIVAESLAFARLSLQGGLAHVEKLADIRTLEEAVELQSSFVASSVDALAAQAAKFSDIYRTVASAAVPAPVLEEEAPAPMAAITAAPKAKAKAKAVEPAEILEPTA